MADYEKKPSYQLTLHARDRGMPVLTGEATLLINVIDVNDNSPVFDQKVWNMLHVLINFGA